MATYTIDSLSYRETRMSVLYIKNLHLTGAPFLRTIRPAGYSDMSIQLYPQLSSFISPDAFQILIVLIGRLRPVIDTALAHRSNHERRLPEHVASFLCAAIPIDAATLSACWTILIPRIDSLGKVVDYHRMADDLFRTYGHQFKLGQLSIF